ncbi:MAG TPA: patatin-like phospholipase family protein [Thermoanaerobaculia bacterium]|nr:patatin-like phospholipase family protein [Thermoanaerobaculia bacterium]
MTDALVRLRAAKKVAFVFSGGSARCAFQIGAIERLVALGIHPSMTIGVSAGAWNAAVVAARVENRARYFWKSFLRMPYLDLRNLFVELSPWRYAEMHRRNFARFVGDRLKASDALPCFISVTRLRDGKGFLFNVRDVEKPIDLLLAANFLPPFYTRTPLIFGERFGDGGVTDNAPYQLAFEHGCDAVVMLAMKGESEGGIYKSTSEPDHEIPVALRDQVIVIRPRHRLPYAFVERRWSRHLELITLGDLRTREVLLGERHAETDIRATGEAPSVRALRWWRAIRRMWTGGRGSSAEAQAPVEPAPR